MHIKAQNCLGTQEAKRPATSTLAHEYPSIEPAGICRTFDNQACVFRNVHAGLAEDNLVHGGFPITLSVLCTVVVDTDYLVSETQILRGGRTFPRSV